MLSDTALCDTLLSHVNMYAAYRFTCESRVSQSDVPSKPPLKIRAQFCNIWGTHKMSCEV